MTLQDWLDPSYSSSYALAVAQPRKLFLLGTAFLTRVRERFPTDHDHFALETTERYANGRATLRELVEAWTNAELAGEDGLWTDEYDCECCMGDYNPDETAHYPGTLSLARAPCRFLCHASTVAARLAAGTRRGFLPGTADPARAAWEEEKTAQYWLYRDLIGDQYSRAQPSPVVLNEQPEIARLLTLIERQDVIDPFDLIALADVVEESGCTESPLLRHLREEGPHFRGCWAIERIAGREMIRLCRDDRVFVRRMRYLPAW
jgi:hypothetical protein